MITSLESVARHHKTEKLQHIKRLTRSSNKQAKEAELLFLRTLCEEKWTLLFLRFHKTSDLISTAHSESCVALENKHQQKKEYTNSPPGTATAIFSHIYTTVFLQMNLDCDIFHIYEHVRCRAAPDKVKCCCICFYTSLY